MYLHKLLSFDQRQQKTYLFLQYPLPPQGGNKTQAASTSYYPFLFMTSNITFLFWIIAKPKLKKVKDDLPWFQWIYSSVEVVHTLIEHTIVTPGVTGNVPARFGM